MLYVNLQQASLYNVLPIQNEVIKEQDINPSPKVFIKSFQDLGEIPLGFDPKKIDDGSGIEKTMIEYKASRHKSCRNKFNATELKRALK